MLASYATLAVVAGCAGSSSLSGVGDLLGTAGPPAEGNGALDGLFPVLGNEERRIREDPAARTTALLQEVFR
jgi:hypothetical protein